MLLTLTALYLFSLQAGETDDYEYTTESIIVLTLIILLDALFTIFCIATYFKSKDKSAKTVEKDAMSILLGLFSPVIYSLVLSNK